MPCLLYVGYVSGVDAVLEFIKGVNGHIKFGGLAVGSKRKKGKGKYVFCRELY